MRRFKVVVQIEDAPDACVIDGIEHDGRRWIVPGWLDSSDGQWIMPERIVLMDGLDAQPSGDDYVIETPIPKAALSGPTPPDGYTVAFWPGIRLPADEEPG